VTAKGWFAARPSGTENMYKLYAESFVSQSHLEALVEEAQQIISRILTASQTEVYGSSSQGVQ
jgi:phosphoglucomutase